MRLRDLSLAYARSVHHTARYYRSPDFDLLRPVYGGFFR